VQDRRLRLPASTRLLLFDGAGKGVAEEHMQVDLADSQSTTVEVANDPGGRLQALNWTQRRSLRPDLPGWSAVEVAAYWLT
jgi:hypothetical protein